MLDEAADELHRVKFHVFLFIPIGIVPVTESDPVLCYAIYAAITDRYSFNIAVFDVFRSSNQSSNLLHGK